MLLLGSGAQYNATRLLCPFFCRLLDGIMYSQVFQIITTLSSKGKERLFFEYYVREALQA